MKKIISALLILTMIFSMVCMSTSAAGITYINQNFQSMEVFASQFTAGAFYVEDNLLFGYNEARTFMSCYTNDNSFFDNGPTTWLTYDTVVELAIAEDEFADVDARVEKRTHKIAIARGSLYSLKSIVRTLLRVPFFGFGLFP